MLNKRPMRGNDFAAEVTRIVLQSMNEENRNRFIRQLSRDFAPDIQGKLYLFIKEMLRSWAGIVDLVDGDAAVIEASRKICDVMGWQPETM